eukprot:6191194-Pleurochrysis_carterae.AAC.2
MHADALLHAPSLALLCRVWPCARFFLACASNRLVAMASTSSMKMMAGAFSRARRKTSRTIRGPSPRYFCTNSEPTTRMNEAVVWCATACAANARACVGQTRALLEKGVEARARSHTHTHTRV